MTEQGSPLRRFSRTVLLTIGGFLIFWLIVSLVVGYGINREVQEETDPFTLTILLPDTDHEQVIRFAPPDVAGLRLDRATWSSEQGPSYDFVAVRTGFTPTMEESQYCLVNDVVDDATGDMVVEAGTCVARTPIDAREPPDRD